MKNRLSILSVFICCLLVMLPLNAQISDDITMLNDSVNNIEINTVNIDVFIQLYDKPTIGYRSNVHDSSMLYIAEHKKEFMVHEIKSTKGELFIYVPKDLLLETCRIQTSYSKINIAGIKSVYFVISGSFNTIKVEASLFKNILVALNSSNLHFESGIVAVADFCISKTKAFILIPEKKELCNVFITQLQNKYFNFDGSIYTAAHLNLAPKLPKKYITVSANTSYLDIKFSPELIEPKEKFNEYGISEFGAKPLSNFIRKKSNFLPKAD